MSIFLTQTILGITFHKDYILQVVNDFICFETGENYMFFPIRRL